MQLRTRQLETVQKVMGEFSRVTSTLVVYPTGCGKTVMFADIIRRFQPVPALVVAERRELVWQARDRILEHTGIDPEIEMGDVKARVNLSEKPKVVISTIQSLIASQGDNRRMGKFDPLHFGLLVIDECHHSTAPSYKDVIGYFRQNPDLRVLGVTATPDRHDEEALGQIFETVADEYEINDAIEDGWLVEVNQKLVRVKGLDFTGMRTQDGDLSPADLSKEMERESNLYGVVEPTLETMFDLVPETLRKINQADWGNYLLGLKVPPKRTLVFTVSVAQAEMLSNIFQRVDDGFSNWICGNTKEEERKARLQRFALGDCPIMVNCGVLIEGYDHPEIEVVAMARPTKSRSRYAQMIGRALRPLPGIVDGIEPATERRKIIQFSEKPACIVLDFVGNAGRHKLVTTADILGGKVSEDAIERAKRVAEKLGKPVNMRKTLDEQQQKAIEEAKKRKLEEEARKRKLVAKAEYITRTVNPFDVFDLIPARQRGWDDGKRLSEKQRAILLKQGIDPDKFGYSQGKQLLIEIFRRWDQKLCSFKLARALKSRGLPSNMTKEQALAALRGGPVVATRKRRSVPLEQLLLDPEVMAVRQSME